ncbi:MAG: hypothetical protein VCB42_02650 [Myxococcota bacterium]
MHSAACWLLASIPGFAPPLTAAVTADEGWSLVDQGQIAGEDYSLYERNVAGSNTNAYRAECVFTASTQEVFDAVMQVVVSPSQAPEGQHRELVRTGADDFVVHTRVDIPLASDRDVNIHIERWQDEDSGALGLVWHATQDEGPDAKDGVVRMPATEGFWRFVPIGDGRTRVIYQNYTDIGGHIPAWVVGPMLRDETVAQLGVLRRMVERSRQEVDSHPSPRPPGTRSAVSPAR